MVAAPAVEVTLDSPPGQTRAGLRHGTVHVCPGAVLFFLVAPQIPATNLSSQLMFTPGPGQSLAPTQPGQPGSSQSGQRAPIYPY